MSKKTVYPNKVLSKPLSAIISDRFIFFLILILGAIGCYYSFGLIKNSQYYSSHEIMLRPKDYEENDLLKYAHTRPLNIDGQMKVGQALHLSVDELLETDPLYVDFGNGEIEKLIGDKRMDFIYGLPGIYDIELFTVQENQKITLSNQMVNIESDYSQLSLSK